jgi:DNA sulfur modification protein DndB
MIAEIELQGILGLSGGVNTFLGFAPANLLHQCSFADVLTEETGQGYQRRFNDKHSLDFRTYIQTQGSTTIPLTFNLRPEHHENWRLEPNGSNSNLIIDSQHKVMSQVDCQHRLGYLADLGVSLPFMTFIGLSEKEEMAIFNTINSKAKGLPGSLLDFHDTKLISDIEKIKPELVLAVRLNDDSNSPWLKMLDLGGNRTSGMQRRASLRTMQRAIRLFLRNLPSEFSDDIEEHYQIILSYWMVLTAILVDEWSNPRKNVLCKGIGVYSLMAIAADMCREKPELTHLSWEDFFRIKIGSFVTHVDWSNQGYFKGLGGEAGVKEATEILRKARSKTKLKVI